MTAVQIHEALADEHLLGAALGPIAPWATWVAVLKAAFGLKLEPNERRAFAKVAGERKPPRGRVRELWAAVSRRAGKSRMAAAVATALAVCVDHSGKLARGETGYVLVLSASKGQAQLVFRYVLGFLEASPILRQEIESVGAEEIHLRGGIVISVHSNNFRSVRGRTLLGCIFDEVAFWRDEASASPDIETYRAILPALATTGGMLIGISSAYRKIGLLYQRHRDYFGKEDADVLVVAGATETFNPTIDKRVIAQARKDDPESAAAEWDGQFREGISSLLDDNSIDAAIDHDRPLELAPRRDKHRYVGFLDSSGGRHDAYTFCIGHKEGHGDTARFIADVVRGRKPPFDPTDVTKEYATLARDYGVSRLVSDAYSGAWLETAVKNAGATYERSELPKSQLYLSAVPFFQRCAVNIPADQLLIRELRLLERRVGKSGKDVVDHPSGAGASDDRANVLAGALYLAMHGSRYSLRNVRGDQSDNGSRAWTPIQRLFLAGLLR
jgi:hypothetical protein